MIFQRLIGNIYSIVIEVLLWVIPGAVFIVFGMFMNGLDNSFHFGYALLGIIAGLILDITLFGPIIILLNIRTSLKNIEKK
ncbi:MAG: hypothetical protein FWD14_03115 [Treponema sp.]|nr:hypothetical protein [Treponema sp.]